MTSPHAISRRSFVRSAALGAAGLSMGWPQRRVWAMPRGDADLRIAFFTDIHARVEWDTPEAMLLAAGAINAQTPDLVLCGGDCITDGFTSTAEAVAPRWQAYLDMHRAIRSTPYTVAGNHDLVAVDPDDGSPPAADSHAEFLRHLGLEHRWQTFEAGGCRFFLLDCVEPIPGDLRYRGWINDVQLAWIRDELEGIDTDTPIVVMVHMPVMTGFFQATAGIEEGVPANRGVVNNLALLELFTRHNLVLVLQGHLHISEMMRWKDTTYITGGAVCGKWWRGTWYGTPEGFGTVTLRGRNVTWDYHTYGWVARRPHGQ